MPAAIYNFDIEQGSTVDFRITYQDSYGTPINLTNYAARMQIRPTYESNTVYANLSSSILPDGTGLDLTPISGSIILPESSGSIGVYISAQTSSTFSFAQALYDLEIYTMSGSYEVVTRLLEGKIRLRKNITRNA